MLLNYQFHTNENSTQTPLVFIHGLFGSLSNLGMLARAFEATHSIVQVDVRNHGLSGHSAEHNYDVLAQDVLETLDHLNIQNFCVVGHSMGGKIAMRLANLATERVEKLVVLDISPLASNSDQHSEIFKALFAVEYANIQTRQQATEIMRQFIDENMVIQFLLKSFNKGIWLFSTKTLKTQYSEILAWTEQSPWDKPSLFLKGSLSDYISSSEQLNAIKQQFPQAQLVTIQGAGHWLHGEKPQEVLEHIQKYLNH